jgi:hypothetical protein|tara:strand:+ start:47 stop:265 length:219 start_codon:yes stop_codon:yes gene_type:complete
MTQVTFQTTILGGLPVEVTAGIAPAEPDVGINYPYAEDFELCFLSGHSCPASIYDRITAREWDTLEEEALNR